jgi:hypothetical protein
MKVDPMNRLTDNQIRVVIVPTHLRWPEAATSEAWAQMHQCVQRLHDFARELDDRCIRVLQTAKLGPDQIAQRRRELGGEAADQLANYGPLRIAEQAAAKEIAQFNQREDLTPQQAQMKQRLLNALHELDGGVAATKRLVQERCGMRDRPKIAV